MKKIASEIVKNPKDPKFVDYPSTEQHSKRVKPSSEYTEGAHNEVGEDIRRSRDQATAFQNKKSSPSRK